MLAFMLEFAPIRRVHARSVAPCSSSRRCTGLALAGVVLLSAGVAHARQSTPSRSEDSADKDPTRITNATFSALGARSIGPALFSGRVGDIAVQRDNFSVFYVAVASGGLWKTTDAGVTFKPIFDSYGSYSIGCVTIDPGNPNTIWVGTGENNSQRSVSYGDGVYVSRDGGKSFTNVGLKDSMHIGMIRVDPRDGNVVYVAAMGNLWADSPERGIYKSTDGGANWERVLHISDMTGCNEVHMDPRNPDVLYATAYQRRRHVWTLINGGPESAIYKSIDAGKTWRKLEKGLPGVDRGRIGMAIAPSRPDVLYAIVEAQEKEGGIYRSTDRGESWEKRCDYMTSSPQYYNELIADPLDHDRFYALDTFLHVSDDGGKTMKRVEHKDVHVDWHALWINPHDNNHIRGGNDGGLYETWDRVNWRHATNLPVTQFYRVAIDNSTPFYYVYGGTQDNATVGGPSRTTDRAGISNEDWFVCVGGDGFGPAIDPEDPNIVYCQWQDGGLTRFDRRSGEEVSIRPMEGRGEQAYVFNWDSPLLLSPHKSTRLYYGGNFLFMSEDRGDSWRRISPILTRGVDRNKLKVMGVVQKPDAVAKHMSTSIFGAAVALTESPRVAGLIYVGADDGLISVTDDDGKQWRRIDSIAGVPSAEGVSALVSDLEASIHADSRVYATFDNHKMGDFAPYVFVSDDRGFTWRGISGDLPARAVCYSIAEDHVNPDLLFVGTESGAFFTLDAGKKWFKVPGMPTIEVRDLVVQRRESDLVMATFGRGFYIMEDYSPLRSINSELLARSAHIFPVRDALSYIERSRIGGREGRGWSGASYFNAPNPEFGATFTYYLKDKLRSRKEQRKEREKSPDWQYPSIDDFREEDAKLDPKVVLLIRDEEGQLIRQLEASRESGLRRITWNLRYPASTPVSLRSASRDPWDTDPQGALVPPGTYSVQLASIVDGTLATLTEPRQFKVRDLDLATLGATGPARVNKFIFERQVADLQRAVTGAQRVVGEVENRLEHLRKAVSDTPGIEAKYIETLESLRLRARAISIALSGDPTLSRRAEPQAPSIASRVYAVAETLSGTTQPPTGTHREQLQIASEDFAGALADLRVLVERDLGDLEAKMESVGAPWTPSRLPEWPR